MKKHELTEEWEKTIKSNLQKKIDKAIEEKEGEWLHLKSLSTEEFSELVGHDAREELEKSQTTVSFAFENVVPHIPRYGFKINSIYGKFHNFNQEISLVTSPVWEKLNINELLQMLFNYTFIAEKSMAIWECLQCYDQAFGASNEQLYQNTYQKIWIPREFREDLFKAKCFLLNCFSSNPNDRDLLESLIIRVYDIIYWYYLRNTRDVIILKSR